MRTFEWIELAAVVATLMLPVATGTRLKRGRMAVLLLAAVGAQLGFEGHRWQLVPLELTAVGLAFDDLAWDDRRVRGLRRFRRGVVGVVVAAAAWVLPAALPIPELPRPGGPFQVGTATFLLVDPERGELYGRPLIEEGDDVPNPRGEDSEETEDLEPRRIVVQAWYPATVPDGAEPEAWNPDLDVVGPALARRLGVPRFIFGHVRDVISHSHLGAAPLSGRFPVVISSHGWTGFRTINLNQLETLASFGFLVLAPDHTYGAIATRFPNGEVVEFDPAALPDPEEVDQDEYDEAAERLVETFSDDLILILDSLEAGVAGPLAALADHADIERVGFMGHSTGGGAATRTCLVDDRCKALVGLDAWVEPIPDKVVARELSQPSMFFRSDEWRGTPNDGRLRGLAERAPSLSYWIGVRGADHNDFVAAPLFSPVADRLGLRGPIPAERVISTVDAHLVGFFERFLLGIGGAVLDEPPPPELDVEFLP